MNPDQSNTKPAGSVYCLAGEDLTGKRSRLVVLTHDTGVPEVKLPATNNDLALFLLNEEGVDTAEVQIEQLVPGGTFRTTLEGTCNPGDELVLADVATAADKGMVRALPATAGVYVSLGIADEIGADGQLVAWRFQPRLRFVAAEVADAANVAAVVTALKALSLFVDPA